MVRYQKQIKKQKQNKLTNIQLQDRNRKFILLNGILQRNSYFLWHSSSQQHAKPLLWNYSTISLTVLYLEVLSSSFCAFQITWFSHLPSQLPDPHFPWKELQQQKWHVVQQMQVVNLLVFSSTLALVHLNMQVRISSYFLEDSQLQLLILLPKSAKNPTKNNQIVQQQVLIHQKQQNQQEEFQKGQKNKFLLNSS